MSVEAMVGQANASRVLHGALSPMVAPSPAQIPEIRAAEPYMIDEVDAGQLLFIEAQGLRASLNGKLPEGVAEENYTVGQRDVLTVARALEAPTPELIETARCILGRILQYEAAAAKEGQAQPVYAVADRVADVTPEPSVQPLAPVAKPARPMFTADYNRHQAALTVRTLTTLGDYAGAAVAQQYLNALNSTVDQQ